MIVNENFINSSNNRIVNVEKMDFGNVYDYRISVQNEFWENFKDSNIILSFWFRPEKPLKEERRFNIHFGTSPYYQFRDLVYPANTNEFKFYECKTETKAMKDSYKTNHFFIRFNNVDLGKTFYLKELKLEKGDNATPYIPNKNSVKADNQAVFLSGGGIRRSLSKIGKEGVLYVS